MRCLALVFLAACKVGAVAVPAPTPVGVATIDAALLRAEVEHLSDDSFNGREAGSEDAARAATYVAERLAGAGLTPLPGDTDLFSDVVLFERSYDVAATTLTLNGATFTAKLGADWRPFPFSDDGVSEAEVVFAGYGITAPEHDYDDYEGLDVKGKIVLILRHEPGEKDADSPFDGTESSEHASFRRKASNAVEHGAIGYLLVTDPLHHDGGDDLRIGGGLRLDPPEEGQGGVSRGPEFRAAHVSRPFAESLLAGSSTSLTALQEALEAGTRPKDLPVTGLVARLAVTRATEATSVAERNVVAFLEGSERPDEWVVIGAHYDHVGGYHGEGDTVFNGADDNASGTAGMMALAQAFASRPKRPARSLVFIGFTAEEKGLLGSKAWVRDNGVDKVVFMLNLDMIGRNPTLPIDIVGDGYGTGMAELVSGAVETSGLQNTKLGGADYFGASDHDSFYRQGVPFLFFFTGIHEDYHQLGDHADKVDFERMQTIVRTGYHLVEPIADGLVTPRFIHHVGWLGAQIDGGSVRAVEAGSRGAEAGLRVGDQITAVGGTTGPELNAGSALNEVAPGDPVMLGVTRGSAVVELKVLRAKTGYLGIFPAAPSEAQSEALGLLNGAGVLVREATDGGPAAAGGLLAGDIILQIGGNPVSPKNLGRVLQRIGAGEIVTMLISRAGERQTLSVTLGERPK